MGCSRHIISFITSLYLLVIHPSDASNIGHTLNEFEKRQLIDWTPKFDDFLKHDDENRTYGDVFGTYRSECDNYSTCVFPRAIFTHPYESDYALLKPMQQGMRFLELGCGSGAAADYFASRCNVEIMCVTNSTVQADLCRWKSRKCNGRVQSPSFRLRPPRTSGGAFRRDLRVRVDRLHKRPGRLVGALLAIAQVWRTTAYIIRSPGSLDACRREHDYRSVTAFFENWRYNFFGANLLVFKLRRLGFDPIRYRQLPFWARGLTFNFIQHLLLWKFRLRMRTMVDLERIIWRTSKVFVFGNGYNIVLASKP